MTILAGVGPQPKPLVSSNHRVKQRRDTTRKGGKKRYTKTHHHQNCSASTSGSCRTPRRAKWQKAGHLLTTLRRFTQNNETRHNETCDDSTEQQRGPTYTHTHIQSAEHRRHQPGSPHAPAKGDKTDRYGKETSHLIHSWPRTRQKLEAARNNNNNNSSAMYVRKNR